MLLKRIEAKTLPEALERVRKECGEDALLVESKPTHRGWLVTAARPDTAAAAGAAVAARAAIATAHGDTGPTGRRWTRGFAPLARRAAAFGISARLLAAVEDALLGTKVDLSRPGDPALPALAERVLAALIRADARIETDPAPRTVAFVGPTGVGKTTTLAKLAGRATAAGKRIALVTLDTYRTAAVEQLRAYADLLGAPLEVAFTPQDVRQALRRHADCDRVFVDTAGRSPLDHKALAAMRGALQAGNASVLLCLAAGTRAADCGVALTAFDALALDAVCLTKWDETLVPGEALSVAVERGLPLSHLGTGQEVPADLEVADGRALARAAFEPEPAGVPA